MIVNVLGHLLGDYVTAQCMRWRVYFFLEAAFFLEAGFFFAAGFFLAGAFLAGAFFLIAFLTGDFLAGFLAGDFFFAGGMMSAVGLGERAAVSSPYARAFPSRNPGVDGLNGQGGAGMAGRTSVFCPYSLSKVADCLLDTKCRK